MTCENDKKLSDILIISFFAGFIGDALLQIMAKNGSGDESGFGLNSYFKKHGSRESLFIAGGMLAMFYAMYIMTGLPLKLRYVAIYGVILDLLFRKLNIFPSLDGYYKYFNYVESAIWGAIPMMVPLLIYGIMKGNVKDII